MTKYVGLLYLSLVLSRHLLAAKIPPNSLLPSRQFCGYQHTDDYPRKNESISLDEFPWSAQLIYNNNSVIDCSGSLIARRYVLTAANCLSTPSSTLTGVGLGDFDVTNDRDCVSDTFGLECSDTVQYFEIEKQIAHPAYVSVPPHHNVALLRLTRDVTYSEYIRPVCLPRSSDFELSIGEKLTTTGWGTLRDGVTKTQVKKKVVATLIPTRRCQKFLSYGFIPSLYLCVKERHTFTCNGDAGAPLMTSERNQWEQVGILVFGTECGSKGPSAYAKVSPYLEWTLQNLNP